MLTDAPAAEFLAELLLNRLRRATADWLSSRPLNEETLLHRLCAHLGTPSHAVVRDVGSRRYGVTSRQLVGPWEDGVSDGLRADVGLTLKAQVTTRTVFLHLVPCIGGQLEVWHERLNAIAAGAAVLARSYLLGVDQVSGSAFVADCTEAVTDWNAAGNPELLHLTPEKLKSAVDWVAAWASGRIGLPPGRDRTCEREIARYFEPFSTMHGSAEDRLLAAITKGLEDEEAADAWLPRTWIELSIARESAMDEEG